MVIPSVCDLTLSTDNILLCSTISYLPQGCVKIAPLRCGAPVMATRLGRCDIDRGVDAPGVDRVWSRPVHVVALCLIPRLDSGQKPVAPHRCLRWFFDLQHPFALEGLISCLKLRVYYLTFTYIYLVCGYQNNYFLVITRQVCRTIVKVAFG